MNSRADALPGQWSTTVRGSLLGWLPAIALLGPSLILTATDGGLQDYRKAQIVALALLALTVIAGRSLFIPSWQACVLAGTILASGGAALLGWIAADASAFLFSKSVMLVAMFLLVDQLRERSFQELMRSMAPLATLLIAILLLGLLRNWQALGARPDFVGLHPNLGGELLFASLLVISFAAPGWLRLLGYAAGLAALALLQSRAALLGSLIIIIGSEAWRLTQALGWQQAVRLSAGILAAASTMALAALLFLPATANGVSTFFGSQILLLDHPERGVGTGLAGRVETWRAAWQAFAAAPFIGHGLDQTLMPNGQAIHNGYLALLAAFGLFAIGPFAVLISALTTAWRKDTHRFLVIIACCVVFFFNARSFNLNIFPLILWLACLPWCKPGQVDG